MSNFSFCVYLTIYRGNKLPPFYIGYSTPLKIKNGYRGSVSSKKYKKIWKRELNDNPHLFTTNIISYHTSRKEANEKECYFLTRLNAINNPLYMNLCIFKDGHLNYGNRLRLKGMQNKKHSDETRRSISRKRKKYFTTVKGSQCKERLRKYTLSEDGINHRFLLSERAKKPVDMYDLTFNYIRTFESIKEASEIMNIPRSNIGASCTKVAKTAGGYVWSYTGISPNRNLNSWTKKIEQYDLNYNLLCVHDSLKDAAKTVNGNIGNISSACSGKLKSSSGFIWKRIIEDF